MKIGHKLFLLLAVASAVPVAAVGAAMIWNSAAGQRELLRAIGDTWSRTTTTGREALFEQARARHLQLVEDKAAALERKLEILRQAVQLQAALVRQSLADEPWADLPPLYTAAQVAEMRKDPNSDFSMNIFKRKPYMVYHLAPGVELADVKGGLDRILGISPFLTHNQNTLPWCRTSFVGHADGFIVGYPGGSNFPSGFDPRTRYWYEKAARYKRTVWTKMYLDKDGKTPVITYASPVYDAKGKLLAVAGIDIELPVFLEDIFNLGGMQVSDALIIDYKGRVRASVSKEGKSKLKLDGKLAVKPPTVKDFKNGEFVPAFRAISSDFTRRSALIATGRDGKEPSGRDGKSGSLFAYARMDVGLSDERSMGWYYVVKTPAAPILEPVGQIARAFESLQGELSTSVESNLRRQALEIAGIVLGVLLLAAILSFFAARSAARPLARISETVGRIAGGDFEARLPAAAKDEIGQVESAINSMAAGLKEGLFIKSTFQRYVPATVVEQLAKNPDLLQLGGERRPMTVFFSDLVGFTPLAEKLSPEALVELINEYLSAMTLCLFSYDGTVDKYEGDAIMAFWGAPLEQPDHALRACRAAIDAHAALGALRTKWRKAGVPELDMRIGLSTGPMVVGNMGSMVKMDYTVLGDAVNLGARLEGANKAYGTKIMISEQTFKAVAGEVEARELDLLAVKGKAHAVRVYELLGHKGRVPEEKLAARRRFEAGLADYRARRWDEAAKNFRGAAGLPGGDPPSEVFLARVQELKTKPPPQGWDGSHTLSQK